MKKSLLALAILGAFAGAASAQSSVTVYGVVDTGFASIDQGGDAGSINGIESGLDGASRIGFKGVEDLGNGLKAEFTLENGINTDDGTGGAGFSRLAFVGLDGGFGKVRLGKQNTQVKDMLGQIDPFGAAGIVNSVDFINGGGLDQRNPNQVAWLSNNFGGFSAGLAYQFGESENNSDNRGYSARLGYKNGPLNVQFGYQNQNSTNAGGDLDLTNAVYDPVAGTLTGGEFTGPEDVDQKNALLGATYDFGAVKLHGIYGEKKTEDNLANTSEKIRSALIGVTVPMGASKIRAEYIRNDNKDVDNADSNVWALSYTYAMSKRTHLYATYVRTSNDDNSDLGIGGPGEGTAGESASGVAVGVAHKF